MSAPAAAFYNEGFADPEATARLPLPESPWLPLYREAAKRVPKTVSVVDLGCGTGRFAKLLTDDPLWRGTFLGIDFSEVAVAEARRYVPNAAFQVCDLRDCELPPADVYVCLEVLEHLDDDLSLLRRLPSGSKVVLSVPSYQSAAHVRTFPAVGDALCRYDEIVGASMWQRVPPPDRFMHLVTGTRR